MAKPRRIACAFAPVLLLAGCAASAPRAANRPPPAVSAPARLKLDPEASPVAFRWLADDAVLVSADVGPRKLAGFGNYVDRMARQLERTRLSVWDDEGAWKLAASNEPEGAQGIAHKRAVYVKDASPADAVEQFLVFDRSGAVVYERDFRSYPLTELD